MKTSRLFRFACGLLAAFAAAAVHGATAVVVKDNSVPEAVTAFRAGNSATAVAALQAKVKTGPNASHPDLQVARKLVSVSATLRSGGDASRASEAATLALTKLALPEGRMTTKDAFASQMLIGGLYEQAGDTANAKLAYQRAVALDATNKQAAGRLALLTEREQRASAKPAANAVLKQRAGPRATPVTTSAPKF